MIRKLRYPQCNREQLLPDPCDRSAEIPASRKKTVSGRYLLPKRDGATGTKWSYRHAMKLPRVRYALVI